MSVIITLKGGGSTVHVLQMNRAFELTTDLGGAVNGQLVSITMHISDVIWSCE